jgi:soluble lytic murein transglycosylase-like protein
MSGKIVVSPRLVLISLMMALLLVSEGHTPGLLDQAAHCRFFKGGSLEFWGYRKLVGRIGGGKTWQVAQMIENSEHPGLVKAIISVESNWDPFALSSREARGLMQIRMIAARELKGDIQPSALYDPVLNVRLGIQILEEHLDYFNGFSEPEHWALTSYNRGRQGTFALNMNPPRTRYSTRVLKLCKDM